MLEEARRQRDTARDLNADLQRAMAKERHINAVLRAKLITARKTIDALNKAPGASPGSTADHIKISEI